MQARAGWSRTVITPPLGLPMGGRGVRFTPGASVLDPLEAYVTYIEDARGGRLLLISLDLIGLSVGSSALLRNDLAALTGTPVDAVILNFSHTHSGPMTNIDKYATLIDQTAAMAAYDLSLRQAICSAAVEAQKSCVAVTISTRSGESWIGINRRNRDETGTMGLRPNECGYINPDLWILDLRAQHSHDRCLLFSYGCHPVMVYGYSYDGISADWVGRCRQSLAAELGENTHCQFLQGLAGNVRPRSVADLESNAFRKATARDVESVGATLASDVMAVLAVNGEPIDVDFAVASGSVLLARDTSVVYSRSHWQEKLASGDELQHNLAAFWLKRMDDGLPPVQAVQWQIGLIQWGRGHLTAWCSGEPVAEWLKLIRAWMRDERLVCWGYCQEVPGYLPTDQLIPEGGYEVVASNFHGKDGPGPYAVGVDASMRIGFETLLTRIQGTSP